MYDTGLSVSVKRGPLASNAMRQSTRRTIMANQSHRAGAHRAGEKSPGAPPKALSARERILETARDSFYREGIRAVGVDTLISRSGVAKMSFYRSFRSKDDLVCAYLESSAAEYWQWWDEVIRPHAHAPRKQL